MAQKQQSIEYAIEDHVIEEFVAEYNDAHLEIESLLLALENTPSNEGLLNDLFRKVHSIKGNAHFLGFDVLANFVHALENVLDNLRKHKLTFDKSLGDVVLQSVDHIGALCAKIRSQQSIDSETTIDVQNHLQQIGNAEPEKLPIIFEHIINTLADNQTQSEINNSPRLKIKNKVNLTSQQLEDLRFFAQITASAEQRSPYWVNRSQRILNVALEINRESQLKVDPEQLEAAVYLHDFGMAFLPLNIIHKGSDLTEEEYESIQMHTRMGAALLGDNDHWLQAAEFIIQHHEREDGSGYPYGIPGSLICDGAKIIAIADAFEAMTNQRANRTNKLSFSEAIKEINQNAGSQFSPYWVTVFNNVIRNKTRKN